jgi:hypothetical protein
MGPITTWPQVCAKCMADQSNVFASVAEAVAFQLSRDEALDHRPMGTEVSGCK